MPRRQFPAYFLTGSNGCPATIPQKQYNGVHARIKFRDPYRNSGSASNPRASLSILSRNLPDIRSPILFILSKIDHRGQGSFHASNKIDSLQALYLQILA